MSTKMERPRGVGYLGWFNAVSGVVCLLTSFGSNTGPGAAGLFIGGIFSLVVGVGLLQLRPWARPIAIVGYILNIVVGIAQVHPLAIIVSAMILGYLYTASVKAAFASAPLSPAATLSAAHIEKAI